jgi:hypothetical protein
MIDILFFLVGGVIGYAISTLSVTFGLMKFVMSHKVKEMEYIPNLPQRRKPPAYVPMWNKEEKEEGAVVMPDHADVIKRDDLKIDDLLQ